ncbi:hypothetical protein ANME2D_02005 [Candidatus Methanoperedens nitroreducens]|uniref:Uncharacterized protein n=1 Tax=Candidatus Methanoperedens nitratireducens TaxID=1392998 RepID=A0A062V5W6_9EURY|nr:hypothetical protein [Candidatus Methanoperedens nitroreducens]KCZ71948.1 hypothetical protein ANME2D_02005 [Candidatus Methanoperedens nitroreducens]MDJ1422075.1 hypothetical protein [Candidatus Methanoperedens sp.]
MSIMHEDFHNIVKNAANELKNQSIHCNKNMRELPEAQLEHEIDVEFRKNNHWAVVHPKYLPNNKKIGIGDLEIISLHNDRIFVEIKSTGFTHKDENMENRLGKTDTDRKDDYYKLKTLSLNVYKCTSLKGFWVWQYFFKTHKPKIEKLINKFNIVNLADFSGPYKYQDVMDIFKPPKNGKRMTLEKFLNVINISSMDTLISILPKIKQKDYSSHHFSILLITSEIK